LGLDPVGDREIQQESKSFEDYACELRRQLWLRLLEMQESGVLPNKNEPSLKNDVQTSEQKPGNIREQA